MKPDKKQYNDTIESRVIHSDDAMLVAKMITSDNSLWPKAPKL